MSAGDNRELGGNSRMGKPLAHSETSRRRKTRELCENLSNAYPFFKLSNPPIDYVPPCVIRGSTGLFKRGENRETGSQATLSGERERPKTNPTANQSAV
jgi:hypothetical protein